MPKNLPVVLVAWTLMTLTAAAQVDPLVAPENKVQNELPRYARLAGLREGAIAKDDVLKAGRLTLWGSPEGASIASFKLTLVSRDMDPMEFSNPGNGDLTAEMRRAVSEKTPGTKLYFEYIRMKSDDGTETMLLPLNFVLK